MRIAQLAPLWKTVPPQKYGGSELVVSLLTEELVKMGHQVTLFACKGSKTTAELVEVIDKPMYDLLGGFSWDAIPAYEFLTFQKLIGRLKDFDIIHNHMRIHPQVLSKLLPCPMVTTLHSSLPPDFPYLTKALKDGNYVSISNSQRSLVPYLNYVATIYHGIKVSQFAPSIKGKKDYLFFIGTLSKNKGIDIAVKAAAELGENLIIAGEIRDEDKKFLDREVLPLIDGTKIKFIGEVDHPTKVKLYGGAKALLFPTQWNEAFGLVMVESLACGTPVIAYNNGSVSEIIKGGETGFIVNNFDDFKESIKNIKSISRQRCREEVENHFDVSVMVKKYIELFQSLL